MLQGILIFVIFLGPLIFFHELGHFLFARFFGVKVEVFSIGFGPKILKVNRGGTEYALSLIPLGGYVKMFGDDPYKEQPLTEEEQKVAFNYKSKFARFWIVFGGPLANIILAFCLYTTLVFVGEKVPEIRFSSVQKNSLFYDQGFRSGDRIKKINDKEVMSFDDLDLSESVLEKVEIERNGQRIVIKSSYKLQEFLDEFFKLAQRPLRKPLMIDDKGQFYGVTLDEKQFDPMMSLDEITDQGKKIFLYKLSPDQIKLNQKVLFSVDPYGMMLVGEGKHETLSDLMTITKTFPPDLQIESIVMDSPADKAGLRKGDIILSLNDQNFTSFESLREAVQLIPDNQTGKIKFLRDGKEQEIVVTPSSTKVEKTVVKTIGVYSSLAMLAPSMIETPFVGPFQSLRQGVVRTVDGVVRTVSGYKKLLFKEVSLNNIGGPIAIGKVATDSFNIGFSMFFRLMAFMSINLGIINLFPIPVLDGGHILFLGLEFLNKGPLSRRKMEIAQRFGMSFLFMLIFVALFNDISRLF